MIHSLDHSDIHNLNEIEKDQALKALESGQPVHFPNLFFSGEDIVSSGLLSESILDGKHKNVSYDIYYSISIRDKIKKSGSSGDAATLLKATSTMLQRS